MKGAMHYIDIGFKAIKIHAKEIESSKALRNQVDDEIKIMLGVTAEWTPDEAIRMARKLADYNITWLEAPMYPQDDIEELRE